MQVVKAFGAVYSVNMPFPDSQYLQQLTDHLAKKVEQHSSVEQRLLMFSGSALNWIAEYILDPSVHWTLETLSTHSLYLTGTGPEWNAIIIEHAQRSPATLRTLMAQDAAVRTLFAATVFIDVPILVRYEDGKYKVLDGMHRAVAAIRDDQKEIRAYVGRWTGTPKPQCEAHVVYDLIRGFQRGDKKDAAEFVTALRFLHRHYSNVEQLLRERFDNTWVPDDDVQECIKKALGGPAQSV
jgi:hypothetical protein